MSLRLSRLTCILPLALLPACGPGKDTGATDPSSSSDSTTASTGTATSTSTGETASAPTSSTGGTISTSGTTGDETDTGDASTTATDPGTSTTTTTTGVDPSVPCDERRTMEICVATDDCSWQTEFAMWSEESGCGPLGGPARCISVVYENSGCPDSVCPNKDNVYERMLGPGLFELMIYDGDCQWAPDGWTRCSGLGDDAQACACFC